MKKYILLTALVFALMMTGCQKQECFTESPILEYTAWEGKLNVKDNNGVIQYGVTLEFFQPIDEENDKGGDNMRSTINDGSDPYSRGARYWQNGLCVRVKSSSGAFENGSYWITSYSGDKMVMEYVNYSKTITLDLKLKSKI